MEELVPIQITQLKSGRYRVQSQSDPEIKYLVKWYGQEVRYTCDCPDGNFRNDPEKPCKHIRAVKAQFAKVCSLCAGKGEWSESMAAPWDKLVKLYFCDNCEQALRIVFK